MKVLAITQARYGSTRLPAKILKEVNGVTLLETHLRRILKSKYIDKLKIATTDEEGSKYIIEIAEKVGVEYYQGSVDDVLSRFYFTAKDEEPDIIVRFTSDCPLIDPEIIDLTIRYMLDHDYDFVATDSTTFPDGLGTEICRFSILERAFKEAKLKSEREHVMPYIWKNGTAKGGSLFKSNYVHCPDGDYGKFRITIDTPEDFQLIKRVIEELGTDLPWKAYIDYINEHKDLYALNDMFDRNEGYLKSINNDVNIK